MKRLSLLTVSLVLSISALAWGQKGHDVVAYIAECHLCPEAAERGTAALGGHSLVYYANWLDNASHTDEYRYTLPWHYANIDEGFTFATMPRNPEGDIVSALELIVGSLERGGLPAGQEELYLRMLIHFVGDIHCPMHAGRKSDRGGNDISVWYFSKSTNLHTIWDTDLVESAHRWSYTEWQREIDRVSEPELSAIASGTPAEWLAESSEVCAGIYADTPQGTRVSYDYVAKYSPVIERQFLRGGLRLAAILNRLYGGF